MHFFKEKVRYSNVACRFSDPSFPWTKLLDFWGERPFEGPMFESGQSEFPTSHYSPCCLWWTRMMDVSLNACAGMILLQNFKEGRKHTIMIVILIWTKRETEVEIRDKKKAINQPAESILPTIRARRIISSLGTCWNINYSFTKLMKPHSVERWLFWSYSSQRNNVETSLRRLW